MQFPFDLTILFKDFFTNCQFVENNGFNGFSAAEMFLPPIFSFSSQRNFAAILILNRYKQLQKSS